MRNLHDFLHFCDTRIVSKNEHCRSFRHVSLQEGRPGGCVPRRCDQQHAATAMVTGHIQERWPCMSMPQIYAISFTRPPDGGVPTPLKNMKLRWEYYSQYMEKKRNVPNHQPDQVYDCWLWRDKAPWFGKKQFLRKPLVLLHSHSWAPSASWHHGAVSLRPSQIGGKPKHIHICFSNKRISFRNPPFFGVPCYITFGGPVPFLAHVEARPLCYNGHRRFLSRNWDSNIKKGIINLHRGNQRWHRAEVPNQKYMAR